MSRLRPTGSKPRRVRASPRGSRQAAIGIATAPMSRLTRKTQRQPSSVPAAAMMTPPRSGPIAVETPITAPSTPNALDLAGPVNECWMVALMAGKNRPAPRPCTILAAMISP